MKTRTNVRSDKPTGNQHHTRAHANGEEAATVEPVKAKAKAEPAAKKAKAAKGKTHDFVQGKGFVKLEAGSITAAAKKVAAAPKTRKAPVKAKPEPKRVATDPKLVERATAHFITLAEQLGKGEINKVGVVRDLALWPKGEKKLQRRDVFEIIKTKPKLEIADATISTQFQFARSGRAKQNA